jgi:hypothetical protein
VRKLRSSCLVLGPQVLLRSWPNHITCFAFPLSLLHISLPGDIEYALLLSVYETTSDFFHEDYDTLDVNVVV